MNYSLVLLSSTFDRSQAENSQHSRGLSQQGGRKNERLGNEKQISTQQINRRRKNDNCETLADEVRRENPYIMYVLLNRARTHARVETISWRHPDILQLLFT